LVLAQGPISASFFSDVEAESCAGLELEWERERERREREREIFLPLQVYIYRRYL
jgi:hypothetical protein